MVYEQLTLPLDGLQLSAKPARLAKRQPTGTNGGKNTDTSKTPTRTRCKTDTKTTEVTKTDAKPVRRTKNPAPVERKAKAVTGKTISEQKKPSRKKVTKDVSVEKTSRKTSVIEETVQAATVVQKEPASANKQNPRKRVYKKTIAGKGTVPKPIENALLALPADIRYNIALVFQENTPPSTHCYNAVRKILHGENDPLQTDSARGVILVCGETQYSAMWYPVLCFIHEKIITGTWLTQKELAATKRQLKKAEEDSDESITHD